MELILKETISSLGREGDIVKVKPGYGRNYLLPKGKAVVATEENKALFEQNRAEIEARLAAEKKVAEGIAKKLTGITIEISQLAGEDERLFGSVTSADIADKLVNIDIDIDKRQILLSEPIKTLGDFPVAVKVGFDLIAEIQVKVIGQEAAE